MRMSSPKVELSEELLAALRAVNEERRQGRLASMSDPTYH